MASVSSVNARKDTIRPTVTPRNANRECGDQSVIATAYVMENRQVVNISGCSELLKLTFLLMIYLFLICRFYASAYFNKWINKIFVCVMHLCYNNFKMEKGTDTF